MTQLVGLVLLTAGAAVLWSPWVLIIIGAALLVLPELERMRRP